MEIRDCPLAGLKLIQLKLNGDSRGFFIERFHTRHFAEAGLPHQFAQDNHSRSAPGILRGMHYQYAPAQGKLVGVVRGKVWDVVVDVRPGSATFGKHFGIELSDENGLLMWIPGGFAHGFCVLGDEPADFFYKVDAEYNPNAEGGIRYDDPALGIEWPLDKPSLSARDLALPGWDDYCANLPKWEGVA